MWTRRRHFYFLKHPLHQLARPCLRQLPRSSGGPPSFAPALDMKHVRDRRSDIHFVMEWRREASRAMVSLGRLGRGAISVSAMMYWGEIVRPS